MNELPAAAGLPRRPSAGLGAKGPRWYDWAPIEVTDPAAAERGGLHWLLTRRRISDGELAFYRARAPATARACHCRRRTLTAT